MGKMPEDKEVDAKDSSTHINLKVNGFDGTVVNFKIKKHASLGKLMNAYCERLKLDITQLRFLYDGIRLNKDHTPKSLNMSEGDVIELEQEQSGGYNKISSSPVRISFCCREM